MMMKSKYLQRPGSRVLTSMSMRIPAKKQLAAAIKRSAAGRRKVPVAVDTPSSVVSYVRANTRAIGGIHTPRIPMIDVR